MGFAVSQMMRLTPQGTTPPILGMIARYDFNGNANDSINGYDCTVLAATLTTDRFNVANHAYLFNGGYGGGGLLYYPADFITTDGYVFAWIKTSVTSEGYIACRDENGPGDAWFFATGISPGKLGVYLQGTSNAGWHTSSTTVCDGTYHHVGFVFGNGFVKLYIDGNLDYSAVVTGSMTSQPSRFEIGERFGWYPGFNGVIDCVVVGEQVLSDAEVLQLYQLSC